LASFAAGDVVTVPFPFSVERSFKIRPALVLAAVPFGRTTDFILCAITSQIAPDPSLLFLRPDDMLDGSLDRTSYIRLTYLFTVHRSLIQEKIGQIRAELLQDSHDAISRVLNRSKA
jgi:mRNA interferase MazF